MSPTPKPRSSPAILVMLFVAVFAFADSALAQTSSTWMPLTPIGAPPAPRNSQGAVIDEVNNRMIVFGGSFSNCPGGCFNDVWVLTNADGSGGTSAWTQLAPIGTPPSVRTGHSAVYSPGTNRMIIFGGDSAAGSCGGATNDVWVLTNANGLGGTPAWMQLAPAGGPPSARAYAEAVYDQVNNRMIIFGGDNPCSPPVNDVWVLSNANGLGGSPTWTQLAPVGGPPDARFLNTAVYDAGSNRMTVFGGLTNTMFAASDVWVLSKANGLGGSPTWTQLAPSGMPPSRNSHSAVLDPASNRMVVFAGINSAGFITNDVWVLSNANGLGGTLAWTPLVPVGAPPPARQRHTAVFRALTNRMTIFAGGTGVFPTGLFNDTWVLTNATGVALEECPPSGEGECEQVDGNGEVDENSGGVGDFNFIVRRPSTTQRISGSLQYVNRVSGLTVQSVAFESLVITGNLATFSGTCTQNGVPCTFLVQVTSGPSGAYTIAVASKPTEGGMLRVGNIRILTFR